MHWSNDAATQPNTVPDTIARSDTVDSAATARSLSPSQKHSRPVSMSSSQGYHSHYYDATTQQNNGLPTLTLWTHSRNEGDGPQFSDHQALIFFNHRGILDGAHTAQSLVDGYSVRTESAVVDIAHDALRLAGEAYFQEKNLMELPFDQQTKEWDELARHVVGSVAEKMTVAFSQIQMEAVDALSYTGNNGVSYYSSIAAGKDSEPNLFFDYIGYIDGKAKVFDGISTTQLKGGTCEDFCNRISELKSPDKTAVEAAWPLIQKIENGLMTRLSSRQGQTSGDNVTLFSPKITAGDGDSRYYDATTQQTNGLPTLSLRTRTQKLGHGPLGHGPDLYEHQACITSNGPEDPDILESTRTALGLVTFAYDKAANGSFDEQATEWANLAGRVVKSAADESHFSFCKVDMEAEGAFIYDSHDNGHYSSISDWGKVIGATYRRVHLIHDAQETGSTCKEYLSRNSELEASYATAIRTAWPFIQEIGNRGKSHRPVPSTTAGYGTQKTSARGFVSEPEDSDGGWELVVYPES